MSDPLAGERGASSDQELRKKSGVQGVILAGGGSTRFEGRPKGLSEVAGRRILDRVADVLERATGCPPILVANAPEATDWRPDLSTVGDVRPGLGSLGGLYTGLVTAAGPILCVAWDMPFVTAPLLEALAEGLEGQDAFLPESPNRRGVEPLCGAYGPACIDPIAQQLSTGDLRMVGFHDRVRVGRLPLATVQRYGDPAHIFWNVNTAGALREANTRWKRHESSRS